MMRKGIGQLVLFCFPLVSVGQIETNFSSDGIDALWMNPSSFGANNKFGVQAATIVLHEWENFELPIRNMISAELSLKHNLNTGLIYSTNADGFIRRYSIKIPVNYRFKLKKTRLGIGAAFGFQNRYLKLNWRRNPHSSGIGDPYPYPNNLFKPRFDMDIGVYWSGKRHYIGASVVHAMVLINNETNYVERINYYLQAGYRFPFLLSSSHDLHLYPIIEVISDASVTDIKSIVYLQINDDRFSLAFGYNYADSYIFGGTARIKQIKFGYFYHVNLNQLNSYAMDRHEFRVSYALPHFDPRNHVRALPINQ